ncbi:Cytochrome P450 4V2 [Holothuria leucospilota]|uniref:Cytochrome P450 4V2 n=1 Tax=Holothuria leucospilota TaxID=206669 RepID=A0A9Q0YKR8_HOLLE|nr:Cytochrome P450 4V2 [Holothuria leucospilota]
MEFTEVMRYILGIAVIGFGSIFVQKMCRKFWYRYKLRNVEGPRGVPFLGNILQFGSNNADFFKAMENWCNEFREVGCFKLFVGFQPVVVVFNPYDMEKIMQDTSLDDKGVFYQLYVPWLGDGLAISKGSKWMTRRKLLTPSFHFSILTQFLPTFNDHAQALTKKLCTLFDGSPLDILPLISLCSLDITCETIMGMELGAQKGQGEDYVHAVRRLGDITVRRIQYPWYWNEALFHHMSIGREYLKCLDVVHQTTKNVIRERKLESQKRDQRDTIIDDNTLDVRKRRRLAFLDLLIEVQKQNTHFTDEGIQEEVDTFMFAGHDTVSASIAFAMYFIGRHPAVQRKIQEELDLVFGNDRDRMVTKEDLQKLDYLSCVMKESQRMMTAVPILARQLETDMNVCGTTIPKGTSFFIATHWLHRDPKQFPNPEIFDPDRFLLSNSKGRHNFAFLPFSAGHRNCLGQKFAIMEQKVILSTLLRKVELMSTQEIKDMVLFAGPVLRSVEGIKMVVTSKNVTF